MSVIQKSVMALALAGMLAACGGGTKQVATGSAKVVVKAAGSQALSLSGQTYVVTVSLTGPSPRGPITLPEQEDTWTGTLDDLPVGTYTVTANADESPSGKHFTSSANCPVTKNVVALCTIDLQQVGGTTMFNDTAPFISAISTSDAAPHYGETVTVFMTASFKGAVSEMSISALCDGLPDLSGVYGSPQETPYASPFQGWDVTKAYSLDLTTTCHSEYTVLFSATDSKSARSVVSMTFPWSEQGLSLEATINHWPDINSITSPDAQVAPGGDVYVTVDAFDPDVDDLSYKWSNDCGGRFDDAEVADALFIAPAASGPCTLSVLVEDGRGGNNTGTLIVHVGEPGGQVQVVIHATGINVAGLTDSPPGLVGGSIKKVPGTSKAEYYIAPTDLFGHSVTVGNVAGMSYWTKKGTLHTVGDPSDWFIAIYTMPYDPGVTGPKGSWYGARIGTDAYLSENLTETAGAWNLWSSAAGNNSLRFFESTSGYFGAYTDPHWAAFVDGDSLAGIPYATQQIKSFSIQTSTASQPTFDGQVAGFVIELKDGSTALVNFEP